MSMFNLFNAAEALGRLGDKKAVEPLAEALNDKDKSVRGNVAEALDYLGWKPPQDTKP